MDMHDFAAIVAALACIGVFVILGLVYTTGDYREFNHIVKQCETQGFIQNDKQRIICSKEVK